LPRICACFEPSFRPCAPGQSFSATSPALPSCVSDAPTKPNLNGFTPIVCSKPRPSSSSAAPGSGAGTPDRRHGRHVDALMRIRVLLERAQLVVRADAGASQTIEAALRVALDLVDLDERLERLAAERIRGVDRDR
jgi:hypothetical protein